MENLIIIARGLLDCKQKERRTKGLEIVITIDENFLTK